MDFEWVGDTPNPVAPVETENPYSTANADNSHIDNSHELRLLRENISLINAKLDNLGAQLTWTTRTLQWMSDIFRGLQSVAAMMPGKGGKMARDMMRQVQEGKSDNG